ncbi:MAG: F0F1 ATP synthase subunit B [Armatimonadetes bacterium]|nr:F0F1 ATP synthase subunit B [Armatimonadota bacterium]
MNDNRILTKRRGAVSWPLLLIVAGVVLFLIGRFAMTGEAFKPKLLEGIDLHLGETVTSIGVFLFWIGAIYGMLIKPLSEAINNRTTSLEKTFTEAELLEAQMETMKAEYEARLSETEANARAQIQAEVKKAQDLRTQIQAEASAKADEMIKKAQEEIRAERDKALVNLRVHVAKVSMLAAEKIIGENMDTDRNRRLVDEFVDSVEVPKN